MDSSIQTPLSETIPQSGVATPGTAPPPLKVSCFGSTDVGRKRGSNEDQFVVATLMRALWIEQSSVPQSSVQYADDRGHLLVVADGMGGAAGGEKASALAIGSIEEFMLNAVRWLLALDGPAEANVLHDFKRALRQADASVCAAAASDPGLRGMGTTLTMAYSVGPELFLAHVGDSRGYLLRGDTLHRLTRDDTLVQQMVEKGLLTPEKADEHDLRHVITNVVGGKTPGLQVAVHRATLSPGDVLLLCTDGLTGMVSDERITAILRERTGPQTACERLIALANEHGGEDNVTAVVACYT